MAFKGSHSIFLSLALLLTVMATTPYVAKGRITVFPAGVRIFGNLYCTPTGNPSPIGIPPPVVNATVVISGLNIGPTVAIRTNVNGFFNHTIVSPPAVNLNLNLSASPFVPNINVTVQLPVQGCPLLPARGALRAVVVANGLLVDNGLVGYALSNVTGIVAGIAKGVVVNLWAFGFSGQI